MKSFPFGERSGLIASPDRHCPVRGGRPRAQAAGREGAAGIPDNPIASGLAPNSGSRPGVSCRCRLPARRRAGGVRRSRTARTGMRCRCDFVTLNGTSGEVNAGGNRSRQQPEPESSLGCASPRGRAGGLPGQVIAGAGFLGSVFLSTPAYRWPPQAVELIASRHSRVDISFNSPAPSGACVFQCGGTCPGLLRMIGIITIVSSTSSYLETVRNRA